jgi:hypothetical protein
MTTNASATIGMAKIYNENSSSQLAIVDAMIPYIYLGIDQLDITSLSSPLIIADFGSSHGKNSIYTMKTVIEYLQKTNKLFTQPLIIHNDLPTNDWTTLFQLIAKDNSYHGMANGHSFYEQCLPTNSLSLGFSTSAVNWLSKIPCKVSNNRYFLFAEEQEREAFIHQAKLDWNSFIEHRSRELVPGGVLVINVASFDDESAERFSFFYDLHYSCAQSFFNPKELSDFVIPVHYRSFSECVDHDLFERCSLKLIKAELVQVKMPILEQYKNGQLTLDQYIKAAAKVMQATFETSLRQALEINGRTNEEIDKLLTKFWILYEEKLREKAHIITSGSPFVSVNLILKKMKV